MNKSVKTALIVAVSLFGAGALIFLCVSVNVGFDLSKLNVGSTSKGETEYVEKSIDECEQNITLNLSSANVTVEKSSDDKIHLTYYNTEKIYFELKETDSSLTLKQKGTINVNFGFTFYNDNSNMVVVSIPSGHKGELNIDCASSEISVSDVELLNNFKINSVSGDVTVENIKAKNFAAEITAGEVELTDLTVDSIDVSSVSCDIGISKITENIPISLETASGQVYAQDVKADKLGIKTISGRVELNDVVGNSAKLSTTAGDVNLSGADFHDIVFTTISGSIEGTLSGSSDDYTVYTTTISGNDSLSTHRGRGQRTLDFTSSSGNFNISFEK